jgi:hypothetical protein
MVTEYNTHCTESDVYLGKLEHGGTGWLSHYMVFHLFCSSYLLRYSTFADLQIAAVRLALFVLIYVRLSSFIIISKLIDITLNLELPLSRPFV